MCQDTDDLEHVSSFCLTLTALPLTVSLPGWGEDMFAVLPGVTQPAWASDCAGAGPSLGGWQQVLPCTCFLTVGTVTWKMAMLLLVI